MNQKRNLALKRLQCTLTTQQKEDLKLVILEADHEGEYGFNGENEYWRESVDETLRILAWELADES